MSIEIILSHRNASDLNDEVADVFGRAVLARVASDVLDAEFRHRMREKGYAVKLEPIRGDARPAKPSAKRHHPRTRADAVAAEASAAAG
jgi:hypothetical protein